jgi:GT2 family glycosyltransferase
LKKLPLISIVVLSYNRPDYLREALESLVQQSYENLEIIVVDNPSPASERIAAIVGQFPGIGLVQTDRNVGYAGGMNKGLSCVSGDYVCLTEDDIVLQQNCIESLVECEKKNSTNMLFGPILYNKNEQTIRCAGGNLSLGPVYKLEILGWGQVDRGQFREPFPVTYVDGAIMFATRDFWNRFRGFREEYFMYVDSVELCARVLKANGKMMIVPKAKAYHFEPAEKPVPDDLEFHKVKNFFSLYLLHAPARILPEFLCRYAVLNGVRTVFARTGTRPKVFFKALWWVAKSTPSLMRERQRSANA